MKPQIALVFISLILAMPLMASELPRSASPEGAKVYFIQPQDGEVITGPNVKVVFGLSGMGIAPAGIEKSNTGHHHLLIDVDNLPMGMPIPSDARHLHFGGGQTEAVIELAPGEHQLQLVLADHLHIPHDPPVVSDVIKITVE